MLSVWGKIGGVLFDKIHDYCVFLLLLLQISFEERLSNIATSIFNCLRGSLQHTTTVTAWYTHEQGSLFIDPLLILWPIKVH